MLQGLSGSEGVPDASAHVNGPRFRRRFVHIPLSVRSHCEHCIAEGPRNATAGVLHKQNLGKCRDSISALGEVSVGSGACNKKAAALLSGSYCVHPHRVSLAVTVKKV